MQEQTQQTEISIQEIRKEFADICGTFQKLVGSINQISNNLSDSMKKVGAITAHVESLAPRVDTLNTFSQSGHQERMVLKSRIVQLEDQIKSMMVTEENEEKIISVIEDEV